MVVYAGLTSGGGYSVQELFEGGELGRLLPGSSVGPLRLNPTASAAFKATALRSGHSGSGPSALLLPSSEASWLLFAAAVALVLFARRRRIARCLTRR